MFTNARLFHFRLTLFAGLFIFLVGHSFGVWAQQKSPRFYPIVKKMLYPEDYDNSSYSNIIQDNAGVTYFAYSGDVNQHYIYEFYGMEPASIEMPDRVSSLCYDSLNQTVLVGAETTFGLLAYANDGVRVFKPLHNVKDTISEVSHILLNEKEVVFYTANRLFIFSREGLEPVAEVAAPDGGIFSGIFAHNKKIFVKTGQGKILELKEDKLTESAYSPGFLGQAGSELRFFNPIKNGQTLIGLTETAKDGSEKCRLFILGSDGGVKEFAPKLHQYLGDKPFVNAVQLNDLFIVATQSNGCLILNARGELDSRLQTLNGLPDNEILNLYIDPTGRMWLTHKSQISWNYFYLNINDFVGLSANLKVMQQLNDEIYLGTDKGLYRVAREGADDIELKAMQSQLNSIDRVQGTRAAYKWNEYHAKKKNRDKLKVKVDQYNATKKKIPQKLYNQYLNSIAETNNALNAAQGTYKSYTEAREELVNYKEIQKQRNKIDYKLVHNLGDEKCLSMIAVQNKALLVGTTSQIYIVKNNQAKLLFSQRFGGYLLAAPALGNRIFVQRIEDDKKNTLTTFVLKDDGATDYKVYQMEADIVKMADMGDGKIMLGCKDKVLIVSFPDGFGADAQPNIETVVLPEEGANEIRVENMGGLIFAHTRNGVYEWKNGAFVENAALTRNIELGRPLLAESEQTLWSVKGRILYKMKNVGGKIAIDSTRILKLMDRVETLYAYPNGNFLFFGVKYDNQDHLIKMNLSSQNFPSDRQKQFRVVVKSAAIEDSILTSPVQIKLKAPSYQNIKFRFTAPFYENAGRSYFEYQVCEGEATPTSEKWEKTNALEVNLPFPTWGIFTLHIRAVDAMGNVSEEAVVTIEVGRPLWANPLVALGVLLLSMGLVFVFFRYRQKSLEAENLRLDRLVSERTAEVTEQKQQVEFKNQELEQKQEEILAQNDQLQQQRLELAQKNAELEEDKRTIINQQTQMAQMAHEAELSKYLPVFAHEIKTPIMTIRGALEYLYKALPESYELAQEMNKMFSVEEKKLIFDTIEDLRNAPISLSSPEERSIRRKFEKMLENEDLEDSEDVARKLVQIGVVNEDKLQAFLPVLKDDAKAQSFLNVTYKLGLVYKQLNLMHNSSERASEFLKTVQTYVYSGATAAGEKTETDLSENINVVLALLDYHIRQGIEVKRDIELSRKVMAAPKELQQVWTNLIMNAVKAMQHKGELSITVKDANGQAEVRIRDNGPGIPQELLPRIFEPGFTTGKKGESTGMGLAICKNIVENHHGHISVSSGQGFTEFVIQLPLA